MLMMLYFTVAQCEGYEGVRKKNRKWEGNEGGERERVTGRQRERGNWNTSIPMDNSIRSTWARCTSNTQARIETRVMQLLILIFLQKHENLHYFVQGHATRI